MSPPFVRFALCVALLLASFVVLAIGQATVAASIARAVSGRADEGRVPRAGDFAAFYGCCDQGGTLLRADSDCPPGHCDHPWTLGPDNPA
ncbi:hypothetical protein [Streptomyces sp. NPDC048659]|uniref:hypothetical protein n=1 Tax=Streptomyces sp. NPDC048659 TaxID=3155489 RepID=UPI003414F3C8